MSRRHAFVASDELSEKIEDEAKKLLLNKSEIIRRAIAEKLESENHE